MKRVLQAYKKHQVYVERIIYRAWGWEPQKSIARRILELQISKRTINSVFYFFDICMFTNMFNSNLDKEVNDQNKIVDFSCLILT